MKIEEIIKGDNRNGLVILHTIKLPISASKMYSIMEDPLNWKIVNFPIISEIEIISKKENHIEFYITEGLLKKKYKSHIKLTKNKTTKQIEYYHQNPSFPFIKYMESKWIFEDCEEGFSNFYIVRSYDIKPKLLKPIIGRIIKRLINKHVEDYRQQLIVLTKAYSISKKF